ncbi:MAG: SDR family NAD(P)-dependent oxidoreductase [Pseudomonadota bacterium]
MTKRILITGATDGIGLEAAKLLAADGHHLLLHGRSEDKLASVASLIGNGAETIRADLSDLDAVDKMAKEIGARYEQLDVLINNAGVFKTPVTTAANGLDVRIVVNTLAPYLLARRLLPLMNTSGRIINLSSAAQAPVDLAAFETNTNLADNAAYAQSKLAITMWSTYMDEKIGDSGPLVVSVNPGSLLATNMVKDAYGIPGSDVQIGAKILYDAALSDTFQDAGGKYWDNDSGQFADPHADALNTSKREAVVDAIQSALSRLGH